MRSQRNVLLFISYCILLAFTVAAESQETDTVENSTESNAFFNYLQFEEDELEKQWSQILASQGIDENDDANENKELSHEDIDNDNGEEVVVEAETKLENNNNNNKGSDENNDDSNNGTDNKDNNNNANSNDNSKNKNKNNNNVENNNDNNENNDKKEEGTTEKRDGEEEEKSEKEETVSIAKSTEENQAAAENTAVGKDGTAVVEKKANGEEGEDGSDEFLELVISGDDYGFYDDYEESNENTTSPNAGGNNGGRAPGMFHGVLDVIWGMFNFLKSAKKADKKPAENTNTKDEAVEVLPTAPVIVNATVVEPSELPAENVSSADAAADKEKNNSLTVAISNTISVIAAEKEKETALQKKMEDVAVENTETNNEEKQVEKHINDIKENGEHSRYNSRDLSKQTKSSNYGLDSSEEWMKGFYSAQSYKWQLGSSDENNNGNNDEGNDEEDEDEEDEDYDNDYGGHDVYIVPIPSTAHFSHLELIKGVALASLGVASVIAVGLLVKSRFFSKNKFDPNSTSAIA